MPVTEMADSKGDDCDIVTETTIVGVTESGVIRKRSVKRKISREDGLMKTADRKYGHDSEEYRKLAERVLAERVTINALGMLQERLQMINFMYQDCLAFIKQWDEQRLIKKHKRRKRRLLFLSFVSFPVVLLILTWLLARLW